MITPWEEGAKRFGKISYGISSFGYDIRLGNQFKIFTNALCAVVDPKHYDPRAFVEVISDNPVLIPPNSIALGTSLELFKIPKQVMVVCLGKSTYARCGIIINVTPFEPEWEGHATMEISNTTPLPAMIYPNEGIGQLLFFESTDIPERTYADKGGKYQDQPARVVHAKTD